MRQFSHSQESKILFTILYSTVELKNSNFINKMSSSWIMKKAALINVYSNLFSFLEDVLSSEWTENHENMETWPWRNDGDMIMVKREAVKIVILQMRNHTRWSNEQLRTSYGKVILTCMHSVLFSYQTSCSLNQKPIPLLITPNLCCGLSWQNSGEFRCYEKKYDGEQKGISYQIIKIEKTSTGEGCFARTKKQSMKKKYFKEIHPIIQLWDCRKFEWAQRRFAKRLTEVCLDWLLLERRWPRG